jgi:serine/threonine protein kinase/WD40 repeat protein/Flp pilus assembly protein TadD
MSEVPVEPSLSAAQAKEIDRICDRFEAAWKVGQPRPDVQGYLGKSGEPMRSALLHQLLVLDWEYRGRCGEQPSAERYREQFPGCAAVIARVASELADPAENKTLPPPVAEGPGSRIGPYKLLQPIGEGGMGVVYMAEQEHPVRRRVALKIIKPGMSSALVIARFEAERQALAMMDHLNIARVLDAGATASRLPYFVMELVHGVPITRYCDESKLTPRERLELFVQVCQAIQHAHQKGVIHRDIKPSNVLVTHYDGKPVPKVIDFGVAKATEQKLSERTVFTHFGAVVGTLQYMAPEQAEMSGLGVDTRADVYSLGVLLYELLTGTTPLDKRRLGELTYVELVRIIKEDEPPRPSARLSTTEQLATIAAQRRTDAKDLPRLVRGELDWIVMKALEKDRTRRYETANGLARDVQRYLADETVEACPPSKGYRLRKFARKNRKVMATAGAFVFLLAAAALASTWQAIRATLAETKTREAQSLVLKQFVLAQESEAKARHAQETAQAERQQAVTNLYHARVEEAAALRRARGMGYRREVFKRLQQALQLDTPDKDKDELRDEAVACLGDFVGLDPITWEDFPARIQKIALTPDGDQMAIALQNGTIELRDVSTGALVARLRESAIDLGMDPIDHCLVTAGSKGTIKRWPDYGKAGPAASQALEMHADLAGMSRNGRFAVGFPVEKDGSLLSVWDIARGEVTARLKVPSGEPEEPLQVSDDGQWVAQASRGATTLDALVWNTPVPQPRKITFAKTQQDTVALAISPDGRFLACRHGDDGLILLDVPASVPRPLIRDNEMIAACFSGDGRFLVYFTNASLKLWNVSQHQELAALGHPWSGGLHEETFLATFSADGNTFATALGVSRSVRIWKRTGSGERLALAGHDLAVPCLAFSPDGKILASGSKDRLVKLWDTATGRLLRALPPFEFPIESIAFSPDGALLATGQYESTTEPVKVWDLATMQAFAPPDDALGGWAASVAFSPDGKSLAACGEGLTIWSIVEGEKGVGARLSFERVIHLPGERSLCVCISPDSKLLAWADHEFWLCLWDLANRREIRFLGPPLEYGWRNVAFSPDGDHVTFCTGEKMIETWDTRRAGRVWTLGHGIGLVTASPNGRWLAARTEPSTVTLWNSQTRSRVFTLPPESQLWSFALSPDGERLAVGLGDGGLAIWNVPKVQEQLAKIGLAWREGAPPRQPGEPQPLVPATPRERQNQSTQYSNLGKRLASVGRLAEADEAYRAALKLLPDDPLAHSNLGKFLEDHARYQEAAAEFSAAIKLQPERGSFWAQRGWAYADMEQWDKASADFAHAQECEEPDEEAWHSAALLYLRDGKLDGYRKTCLDMLQRFGEGAVWTCTVRPDSGADPARLVSLAEKALARSPNDHWHVNRNYRDVHRLGAALYRAGQFKEAVQRLTEASELSPHPYRTNMLCTWFFLAMAHHRLGHTDEARRWLEKGVQGTERALNSSAGSQGKIENCNGVIPLNWSRRLTLQLVRREAEQLVNGLGTGSAK